MGGRWGGRGEGNPRIPGKRRGRAAAGEAGSGRAVEEETRPSCAETRRGSGGVIGPGEFSHERIMAQIQIRSRSRASLGQISSGVAVRHQHTLSLSPYNLLLPWLSLSLSSTPQSKTTTQCPLPTLPSTLPHTPVPSLAPPSHGALAPSVTAIVTSPVLPPANS